MRFIALAVSSMLSPVLLAQTRVPEVEPNNTNATAQPILVGDQIDCSLPAAGDQDWFVFTVPAAGRIRIHTSNAGTGALPAFADTRIALLDATGTTYLAIDDDARGTTNGWGSELQTNITAGTYMCQVTQFALTDLGPYSLEIASITPVVYDGVEAEPNDSHLTATPTGVLGLGARRFHGSLGANTVVLAGGVVDAPAIPPVVYSGVVIAPTTMFTGVAGNYPYLPAGTFTTTATQSATPLSQPMANPPLASYVPGMNLVMTSGPNVGLARLISSNTAIAITSAAFPVVNAAGNTYDIVTTNTTTVTWVGPLPVASMFTGNLGYSMVMTSGVNAGLTRTISAGTGPAPFGSALTTAAFPVANGPGDTFDVICTGSNQAVRVVGALVPNAWNPITGGSSLGRFHIRFTSGVNAGLYRQIRSNTGASITTETTLAAAPGAGDTFDIEMVDADYYQVVLTAPRTGFWFQINEGDNGMVYGHRYELYDAAGNALLPATSVQNPAFGTQNGTPVATIPRTSSARVLPAGTYYVAIRNPLTPFAASTTMPAGVVPTGNYMLELFTMPLNTGSTVVEAEAPGTQTNNTTATAQPLLPGDLVQGNLTASTGTDPSDWYGIVIPVPSSITFQTRRNGASATPMLDSTLNLRDSTGAIALTATTGNVLDVPSNSTSGPHGRIVVTFYLTPGTYYIDVTAPLATTGSFGDYELETSALLPAPYVAASYAVFASNAGCGAAPQPTLVPLLTGVTPAVNEVPATGTLFIRHITNMNGTPIPGGFIGLHVMGLANPPALDLAIPFGGTLGACFLNVSPDLVSTVISDGAGVAELRIAIPGTIALRGTVLWEQGYDFDLTAPNGFFLQPGNYGRFLVGERTY